MNCGSPILKSTDADSFVLSRFLEELTTCGFPFRITNHWPIFTGFDPKVLDQLGTIIARHDGGSRGSKSNSNLDVLISTNAGGGYRSDLLTKIKIEDTIVYVNVASTQYELATAYVKKIKKLIPEIATTEDKVRVAFWTMGGSGPSCRMRMMEVPKWETIKDNYTKHVRDRLDVLMNLKNKGEGQLILWRGEPGTGKTWAIRALMREWGDAIFNYVVDPDIFFGSRPDYMMNVILGDEYYEEDGDDSKWKVLILEDSGELLTRDAKLHTGQGLSRLLNIVDGLIGQGLKLIVLVTTNEELGKLHDAVSRPGRCLMNLEFKPLEVEEAIQWLRNNKIEHTFNKINHRKLAELYALVRGEDVKALDEIGFTYRDVAQRSA